MISKTTPPRRPSGWARAINEYVTAMRAANRAPGTVRLHRSYLGRLAELHRSPWRVTHRDLLAFQANEDWSAETRKSARSVLVGFYGWAFGSGYLDHDPADGLPGVKVPKSVARPAPEFVVRLGLRDAEPREEFMIRLGRYAGMRCAEIARVHGSHFDRDRAILVVLGKGGKTRLVHVVEPELLARLEALDGYAFPNRWTGKPITPGHVSRLLSRALAETWTGHTLRHGFGTAGYAGTKDLIALAEAMGHEDLRTTQKYVASGNEALRAVSIAAAPDDVRRELEAVRIAGDLVA